MHACNKMAINSRICGHIKYIWGHRAVYSKKCSGLLFQPEHFHIYILIYTISQSTLHFFLLQAMP